MTTYTIPHNLPILETTDLIAASTDGLRQDLNAISTAANLALDAVKWDRGINAADLNTVQSSGRWAVNSTTVANLPVAVAGTVQINWGSTTGTQTYVTREATPRVYHRAYLAGVWGAWTSVLTDAKAYTDQAVAGATAGYATSESVTSGDTATLTSANSYTDLRGTVPAGADLNEYRTPAHNGRWLLLQSRIPGYLNMPVGVTFESVLEVISGSTNVVTQRVTERYQWFTHARSLRSAPADFTAWKPIDLVRGPLPAGANLNDYRTPAHAGVWSLEDSRLAGYLNLPPGLVAGGVFEVMAPSGSVIVQRISERAKSGTVQRSILSPSSGTFTDWVSPLTTKDIAELIVDTDYTGATNATPAINAAIASAATFGFSVRLKAGSLRLESPITPVSGTKLRGMGIGATILKPYGTGDAIKETSDTILSDVTFEDFEIDGTNQVIPSGGYTPAMTKGVFIQFMRRVTMRNLYIHDTGATGLGIDHITGTIENVWAVGCGRFNNGNEGGGSGIGIGVGELNAAYEPLTITSCHTEGNKRFGIFVETQMAGAFPEGVTVMGCTAKGNKDGFGEAGCTGTRFIANHAIGNTRSGISLDHGTFTPGNPGINTLVSGNNCHLNVDGIIVYGQDEKTIEGIDILDNRCWGNTQNGVKVITRAAATPAITRYLTIMRNRIHNNGYNGIFFTKLTSASTQAPWKRFAIENNRIWNNGKAGVANENCAIKVTVDTDRISVRWNDIWDDQTTITQTRAIIFAGTHTNHRINSNETEGTVTLPA